MTINLHELANIPGYGNAEKELRKAGLWRIGALEILWSIPDDGLPPKIHRKIDDAIEILEAIGGN